MKKRRKSQLHLWATFDRMEANMKRDLDVSIKIIYYYYYRLLLTNNKGDINTRV